MTDLNHQGMRPGIVRILAEYPEIQLENDASAKEFKVIIKRIIQKREVATQKREVATQKREAATQKREAATQKRETATQKGQFEDIETTQKKEIATQKNLNTTQKKVLEYFKDNPKATRVDAANAQYYGGWSKIHYSKIAEERLAETCWWKKIRRVAGIHLKQERRNAVF